MALRVTSISEQYFQTYAHRFLQGEREVFSFALDLAKLDGLLPQRVDEDLIKDANRRLTLSHAKQITEYLRTQTNWVLGAILLGIDPSFVEFIPFKDEREEDTSTGLLRILQNHMVTLKLFDGQHRRRAVHDVLAALREEEAHYKSLLTSGKDTHSELEKVEKQLAGIECRRKALEAHSIPIVLYAERNTQALRQMFADAAKAKPIEAITKARFDERDPFNRAAKDVSLQSELFQGRIDMERSTIARTSPNLLSFNQLAAILKTLMFGYYGRVSRLRLKEFENDIEPVIKRGLDWADEFLPSSCRQYEDLLFGSDRDDTLIPLIRKDSFAFNATIFRVLAACYHGWITETGPNTDQLAQFLKSQSFKNTVKRSLFVKSGLVLPGATSPIGRRQEVSKAISYILAQAKNHTPSDEK